jgi:uncharacterized protein
MKELERLEAWYRECPGALVAFSGGVDSSLVAFLGRHFLGAERVMAVISASPSLKLSDLDAARSFALGMGLRLKVIATQEMENPDYFNNPSNRCYFCKHTLYDELAGLSGDYPDWWILNGTNLDDTGDYRPGLKAAEEFEVRSPLIDCEIDKAGVRRLAEHFELVCWDKPASPCLSSRVPYGEQITVEKLRQIEAAEALVTQAGFRINRVRHYGDQARVEVEGAAFAQLDAVRAELTESIQALGFRHVKFDAEGFVSGKLNRAILSSEGK